jgi:hypothetical protein
VAPIPPKKTYKKRVGNIARRFTSLQGEGA